MFHILSSSQKMLSLCCMRTFAPQSRLKHKQSPAYSTVHKQHSNTERSRQLVGSSLWPPTYANVGLRADPGGRILQMRLGSLSFLTKGFIWMRNLITTADPKFVLQKNFLSQLVLQGKKQASSYGGSIQNSKIRTTGDGKQRSSPSSVTCSVYQTPKQQK